MPDANVLRYRLLLGWQVFVGLHLLVTRQEGVLYLKDKGVLVQEIASVRVSNMRLSPLFCGLSGGERCRQGSPSFSVGRFFSFHPSLKLQGKWVLG